MRTTGWLLRSSTIVLIACLTSTGCEETTTRFVEVEVPGPAGPAGPPGPPGPQGPPAPPPSEEPPPTPSEPPEGLADSLNALGFSTADTPRISNEGVALPARYSPFGRRIHVTHKPDGATVMGSPLEMALLGFSLEGQNSFLTTLNDLPFRAQGTSPSRAPQLLARRDVAQAPWARENANASDDLPPITRRDAASGDTDGDGLDELALVRIENGQLVIEISPLQTGAAATFQGTLPVPLSAAPAADVRIASGDLDDDGRAELVIAVSGSRVAGQRTGTRVLVLDDRQSGFALLRDLSFESTLQRVNVHVVLETGNIDYDVHEELVVVVNEIDTTGEVPAQAATRLFVFDDAARDFAQLVADTPTVVTTGSTQVAEAADVAIGDFDDDDINEVVAGGITGMVGGSGCGNEQGPVRYVAAMYEFDGRTREQERDERQQELRPGLPELRRRERPDDAIHVRECGGLRRRFRPRPAAEPVRVLGLPGTQRRLGTSLAGGAPRTGPVCAEHG